MSQSSHRDFEVVVCENGGEAAADALRAAAPAKLAGGQAVRVFAADNPGYAGGVNRCIEATRDADAWWVLNPDTRPEPDAMAALLRRLARGDVEACGGVLYGEDRVVQGFAGGWSHRLARPEMIGRGSALETPVDPDAIEARTDYLVGASMMVTPRFVAAAGLMREEYFLYCEEVEWFVRAKQHGQRLGFAPDCRVLHLQGTTTGAGSDVGAMPRLPVYLNERNKLHVVRDSAPAALLSAIPASLLLLIIRYGRNRAWRQMRWALAGWLAGVRNERGKV